MNRFDYPLSQSRRNITINKTSFKIIFEVTLMLNHLPEENTLDIINLKPVLISICFLIEMKNY